MITIDDMVRREVHYCASGLMQALFRIMPGLDLNTQREICLDEDDLLHMMGYFDDEGNFNDAYEHWIVSDWLAAKLAEKNELIDRDVLGLTIWGRCCTGQSITMDHVIKEIYSELVSARAQI